jgi:hypothetical protein
VSNPFDDEDDGRYLGRKINRDLSHLMKLYGKKSLNSKEDKEDDEDKDDAKSPVSSGASSRPRETGAGDDGQGADPDDPSAIIRSRDLNELIDGLTDGLRKKFDRLKQELREEVQGMIGQAVGRLLAGELESQLGAKVNLIVADQEKRAGDLFSQLRELISSTRPPDIHVSLPAGAIQVESVVKQLPVEVNLSVPAEAIKLESKSLLDAAVRRRTTIKNIEYDPGSGRPLRIVEESE